MKWWALLLLSVLAGAWSSAAQTTPVFYAESYRKGATRVTEERFEARLTPQDPDYRELVKDAAGNDRYEMTIAPQGPSGDTKITSWSVRLRDLRHNIYHNILMANQEPSSASENNLWWLNPNPSSPVSIRARRIVRVDSYYVVIQVKDMHFTPLDSPYLDSMTVYFEFVNADPRSTP